MGQEIETQEEVTLANLLQHAEQHFNTVSNINWWIYHVKLDWEARGHLKLVPSTYNNHAKILRLTVQGQRSLRTLTSLPTELEMPSI
jgi:hypothetical protein